MLIEPDLVNLTITKEFVLINVAVNFVVVIVVVLVVVIVVVVVVKVVNQKLLPARPGVGARSLGEVVQVDIVLSFRISERKMNHLLIQTFKLSKMSFCFEMTTLVQNFSRMTLH